MAGKYVIPQGIFMACGLAGGTMALANFGPQVLSWTSNQISKVTPKAFSDWYSPVYLGAATVVINATPILTKENAIYQNTIGTDKHFLITQFIGKTALGFLTCYAPTVATFEASNVVLSTYINSPQSPIPSFNMSIPVINYPIHLKDLAVKVPAAALAIGAGVMFSQGTQKFVAKPLDNLLLKNIDKVVLVFANLLPKVAAEEASMPVVQVLNDPFADEQVVANDHADDHNAAAPTITTSDVELVALPALQSSDLPAS